MNILESDFWVTRVQFVVDRAAEPGSGNRKLSYPDDYVLVFCLEGAGLSLTDGKQITMHKNDVCLLPPENVREYNADREDPWHVISVSFRLDFRGDKVPDSTEAIHFPDGGNAVRELFQELSAAWQEKDALYDLKCRTIIQQLLLLLLKARLDAASAAPAGIVAARQYIRQHFTEEISLDKLAAQAGFSSSHFRKLFTAHVGMSPKQFVLYLRLSKAKNLLASNSFRVGEVAGLCGFRNEFYFSDLFKRTYGLSPKDYRLAKSPHRP